MQTTITKKSSSRILPWLLTTVFLDHTSINIIFPVLTIICFDTRSSLFSPDTSVAIRGMWYGLIISIYHFGNIIAAPLLGIASDYLGRRLLLLVGALGALIMASCAALSLFLGMVALLLLGRAIGGICATKAVTQAAIGDLKTTKAKALNMGYLQALTALGATVGPLIGGYTATHGFNSTFNFTAPFLLATLMALLSVIVVLWKLPETLTKRGQANWQTISLSFKTTLAQPRIIKISLLLFLSQFSWSLYYQYIPPILKDQLQFNATQLGLFLSLIALWLVLSAGLGLRLLKRWFNHTQLIQLASFTTLLGLALTLLGLLQPGLAWHRQLIWLAAIPVAVGDVIAYIVFTTLYSDAVDDLQQGLIMGICLIVAQTVWFLTGLIGGALLGVHLMLPMLVAPIGIIILLGLLKYRPNFLALKHE